MEEHYSLNGDSFCFCFTNYTIIHIRKFKEILENNISCTLLVEMWLL